MTNSASPQFKKCPTCGSTKIGLVRGNYQTTARGKPIVVANVRRHECSNCGEVLLDYEAVKKIELRRSAKRKLRQRASA
ncbi:MAG: YgiT-type zinc finger protein [Planctomycetes bacterium]|nr:YgiT-type zinc finger protein [Planctomycetota bacterium]